MLIHEKRAVYVGVFRVGGSGACVLSDCCALQVGQQLQAVTEHVQRNEDTQPGQVRLGNVAAQLCVL